MKHYQTPQKRKEYDLQESNRNNDYTNSNPSKDSKNSGTLLVCGAAIVAVIAFLGFTKG